MLELARARGYRAIEATALRLLAARALSDDPAAARQHLAAARTITDTLGIAPEQSALATLEARLR